MSELPLPRSVDELPYLFVWRLDDFLLPAVTTALGFVAGAPVSFGLGGFVLAWLTSDSETFRLLHVWAGGTVLAVAAALSTLAILVKGALESATAKSEVDNLSGLYNRRGFERVAGGVFDAADLTRQPLTLIVADIDHFKSINDRFGHAAGDQAIRAFLRS